MVPTRRAVRLLVTVLVLAFCGVAAGCSSSATPPAATPPTASPSAGAAAAPLRTCAEVVKAYKAFQKQEQQAKASTSLTGAARDKQLLALHTKWAQLIVDHPDCFAQPEVADAQSFLDLLKTPPPPTPKPAAPTPTPCPTSETDCGNQAAQNV